MYYDLHAVDQVFYIKILNQKVPHHTFQIFTVLRDEQRCLTLDIVVYIYYLKSKNTRKQKVQKGGNLIVVQNHAMDSQMRRKLKNKWLRPYILVMYIISGLSA